MNAPDDSPTDNSLAAWQRNCPLAEVLRAPEARGQGVRIALVDTAVQWDLLRERHSLASLPVLPRRQSDRSLQVPTHGTLMADILLRQAPCVHLESTDVFNGRTTAEPEALVDALAVIRKQGRIQAVNLSLGIPEDRWDTPKWKLARQALAREVLGCYRAGIVLIASAHNAHPVLQSAPADNPSPLISVAKGPSEDPLFLEYHPGDTAEFRGRGLGYWGVTRSSPSSSCAAAHVAGLACRLLGMEPSLRPFQVKSLLAWYAEKLRPA